MLCVACAPVMRQARLDSAQPPSERELQSAENARRCHSRWALLFPGLTQICQGRTTEGAVLAGLGAAELGAAVGVRLAGSHNDAARDLPLLAYGDALTLSVTDAILELQRGVRLPYVPQESLTDLVRAPFARDVISRPEVWAGIAGTLAAGLLVSRLVDGPYDTRNAGKRPVLFGNQMNSAVGYPLAGAIGVTLFEHVALAEETTFRGLLQSGWARTSGETRGWIYGSLAFGVLHASNIFFMDSSQRLKYLAIGVPFITVLGSYLGLAYRWNGYSLGPPVAIHFWYDFLLEAVGFIADPKNSPLALSFSLPF